MTKAPSRWFIAFLMFLGIAVNYIDRVNISHAIPLISKEMNLSKVEQGFIMSAFSWGYVALMPFGGWLIDRFGPRMMNAAAAVLWSVFTGLSGFATGLTSLIAIRFCIGAAEAPIFPGNAYVVRSIFPVSERGRATAIFDVGSYIGAALAGPITVYFMLRYGWRTAFVVLSTFGILWTVCWLYYFKPEAINVNDHEDKVEAKFYFRLLRERKIVGICIGFFCYNYIKSFFLTWFPTFLVEQRGLSFMKVGYYSLIPPVFAVLGGLIAGFLTDKMLCKNISLTVARKLPLCLGMLFSSVIVLAAYFPSPFVTMTVLSLSYMFLIAASPGIWAIPGDLAVHNNEVGRIGGLQNTFSNMAGIIAPIITGALYEQTNSFLAPLGLTAILGAVGAYSYWFMVGELKPLTLSSEGVRV